MIRVTTIPSTALDHLLQRHLTRLRRSSRRQKAVHLLRSWLLLSDTRSGSRTRWAPSGTWRLSQDQSCRSSRMSHGTALWSATCLDCGWCNRQWPSTATNILYCQNPETYPLYFTLHNLIVFLDKLLTKLFSFIPLSCLYSAKISLRILFNRAVGKKRTIQGN